MQIDNIAKIEVVDEETNEVIFTMDENGYKLEKGYSIRLTSNWVEFGEKSVDWRNKKVTVNKFKERK